MMAEIAGLEQEIDMKQLKRTIECWREVILPLNSILLWERSWYPGLILGLTTTIFFMIWMMEPALLTMIALSLLVIALVDYLVPTVTSVLSNTNKWTGQKEKKLDEICQNLSITILQLQSVWRSIAETRMGRPNIYHGVTILCLALFAWIGNTINNLLLFYITVNAILLTPGLRHKGRASTAMRFVYDYLSRTKKS